MRLVDLKRNFEGLVGFESTGGFSAAAGAVGEVEGEVILAEAGVVGALYFSCNY